MFVSSTLRNPVVTAAAAAGAGQSAPGDLLMARKPRLVPYQPTVDERAAAARAARLASQAAPPVRSDVSVWDDPEDLVNTREPKQVRGRRRGDALNLMHRRGTDVTRDHVYAAGLFKVDWDIATIGQSGGSAFAERIGSSSTQPSPGPTALASNRAAKQREVARVLACIGVAATPLLLWVVVHNRDVAAWCGEQRDRYAGSKPDPKKEFGKLLGTLSRLAEYYGVDSDRDRAKAARADLERK